MSWLLVQKKRLLENGGSCAPFFLIVSADSVPDAIDELACLRKCRGVLIRYNKRTSNYLGLLQLASELIWYRRDWKLTRKRVLR